MATIGDLVVNMRADVSQFQSGMQRSAELTRTTERSLVSMSGASTRTTFAVQQLAFGVQDFAQVVGPMGVGRALGAMANNIVQVGSIAHPVAGTIAALSIAAVQLGVAFMQSGKQAESAASGLHAYQSALSDIDRLAGGLGKAVPGLIPGLGKAAFRLPVPGEKDDAKTKERQIYDLRQGILDTTDAIKARELTLVGLRSSAAVAEGDRAKQLQQVVAEQTTILNQEKERLTRAKSMLQAAERELPPLKAKEAALARITEEQKKQAEEAKKLADAREREQASLKAMADAIKEGNLTPRQRLDRDLKGIQDLRRGGFLSQQEMSDAMQTRRDRFANEGNSLVDRLASRKVTPREQAAERLGQLREALRTGLIDRSQMAIGRDRILADLQQTLVDAAKVQKPNADTTAGAVQDGTAEAWSAIMKASGENDAQKQMRDLQKKTVEEAKKIVDELRKANKTQEDKITVVQTI